MQAKNAGPPSSPDKSADPAISDHIDDYIDLRGEKCPLNFVKTKLKLEEMEDGQNLQAIVDGGEAMQNIPRSLKEEGHRIIKVEKTADDGFSLLIKKGGGTVNG